MGFLKSVVSKMPQCCQQRLRFWHYSRKLAAAQMEDEAELGAVGLLVKPGQTVMDIGANFGLFTRFLSESVGPEGKVFSFEPTDDMFAVLDHNVKKFGYDNTLCSQVALSDSSGITEIRIPKRADGTLNHYESTLAETEVEGDSIIIVVKMVTLDEFCEEHEIDQVDFIKCDVEGHELAVLSGAEQLIGGCLPTILLEVNEPLDDGAHGTKVRELVESMGYVIHTYDGGKLSEWEPGQIRVNYVLMPPLNPVTD